jgi:serine/threonine-protein kinase
VSDDATRADELRRRVESAVGAIFEIEEEIGRGGMAVVYRALDKRLRRRVALKVLPPELAFRTDVRSRFVREAQLAAQLTHPHVVPIFSVEETGGIVYFAMGLIEGETLARQLHREPRPDVAFVRRVLREVCDGLAYAHAHGVVHRDIKPDNILIEKASGRALVSDFGIARAAEGDLKLTATGVAVGTPAYMSPEQAMGDKDVDGRSDLYALGVVGWQMLAGELPFQSENTPGMLMKHISEPPRPLHELRHDLPDNLVYAIERAMAKGRDERWADATAFRDALDERVVAPEFGFAQQHFRGAPRDGNRDRDRVDDGERHRDYMASGNAPVPASKGRVPGKPWRYEPMKEEAAKSVSGAHAIREWREQRNAWREKMRAAQIDHEPLSRRELRRMRREGLIETTPEDRIRSLQRHVVSTMITVGFLAAINLLTSPRFPWFLFPALGMGIGIAARLGNLWVDGIPLRRLFQRQAPSAPGEAAASAGRSIRGSRAEAKSTPRLPAADLSGVPRDVLDGPHGSVVREAAEAKVVINDVVTRLPETERFALPDVQSTAAALEERIRALAGAMHQLDRDASPDALRRLDQRLAEARAVGSTGDDGERERRVGLLERQHATLKDLADRRTVVGQQLENASILLQTMKLDLLKLRSSGIETKIADSTMATQEARAVATYIQRLVDAANEVRRL